MAVGDIHELRVYCLIPTQIGVNVFHYLEAAETLDGVVDTEIADFFSGRVAASYKAAVNLNATFWGVTAQRIKPTRGIASPDATDRAACTGAGQLMPTQASGIISAYAGGAARNLRARAYIPFPGSSFLDLTSGEPTAAYKALLATIASKVYEGFVVAGAGGTATLQPIVYHRATGTGTVITDWIARQKWATQRRRGMYGRENSAPF